MPQLGHVQDHYARTSGVGYQVGKVSPPDQTMNTERSQLAVAAREPPFGAVKGNSVSIYSPRQIRSICLELRPGEVLHACQCGPTAMRCWRPGPLSGCAAQRPAHSPGAW
jgi:hypothetical protein